MTSLTTLNTPPTVSQGSESSCTGTAECPHFAEKRVSIVSLGYRCATAFQVRRIFGIERALPFDWLVTPLHSIETMIRDRFTNIVNPELLSVLEYAPKRHTIWNSAYEVYLHHDFPRSGPSREISSTWREHLESASSKWLHVVDNFCKALEESERILFIRQGGEIETYPTEKVVATSPREFNRLYNFLQSLKPEASIKLLLLNCSAPREALLPGILTASVDNPPHELSAERRDDWHGYFESWEDAGHLRDDFESATTNTWQGDHDSWELALKWAARPELWQDAKAALESRQLNRQHA